MLTDMEELSDLGSIEMKPIGKAAFMSCCCWSVVWDLLRMGLRDLLMRFPCWAMWVKGKALLLVDVIGL